MSKALIFIITVSIVLMSLLTGCDTKKEVEIESIKVTFTDKNKKYSIDDQTNIDFIDEYIKSSLKQSGLLDAANPAPIELELLYNNDDLKKINLYVSIQDKISFFTYSDDTSTGYQASEAKTDLLKDILFGLQRMNIFNEINDSVKKFKWNINEQ